MTFTQYPVCGKYESLMAAFELELLKKLGSGTARGGMGIIRRFLYFLEQSGKSNVKIYFLTVPYPNSGKK